MVQELEAMGVQVLPVFVERLDFLNPVDAYFLNYSQG